MEQLAHLSLVLGHLLDRNLLDDDEFLVDQSRAEMHDPATGWDISIH